MALPDVTLQFCEDFHCSARIDLPDERAKALLPFFRKRHPESTIYGAAYRGKEAWNHLTVILNKREKRKAVFVLNMHTHTAADGEKERRSSKLPRLLNALGEVAGQTTLRLSASFGFPKNRFKPAVVFPDTAGLAMPLLPDARVRITGLRFRFDTGSVESLIVDVHDEDEIFVATTLQMTTRISESLPEECLNQASAVARKLVVAAA